jgi:hypothetical protein
LSKFNSGRRLCTRTIRAYFGACSCSRINIATGLYVDEDLASEIGESAAHAAILLTHEEAFGLWRSLSPKEQAEDLRAYLVQMTGVRISMKEVLSFALRLAPPTALQSEIQFFLAEVYLLFRHVPGVR